MPAITVFSECQKVAGMARSYGGITYQKNANLPRSGDLQLRFVLPGIMITEEERF